jgi:hypothetical protein
MVPLMFLLILTEELARRRNLMVKPIATTGLHPGSCINLQLVSMMIVGLALSLRSRPNLP